ENANEGYSNLECNGIRLSKNGKGIEALQLFEDAKSDYVTFVNVVSACSHMGSVERGWIYFKMMSNEFGISPRVDHYACMVNVLSPYVGERLTELGSQESSAYVLLSSIYISLGMREGVEQVKEPDET
ncbi:hypothetical protein DVH24_005800, partial [Malus domestica]